MTAVERIKAEELSMQERLRAFQDAAEAADDYLLLSQAWWQYAESLTGYWRSVAQDIYATNLKRTGIALE